MRETLALVRPSLGRLLLASVLGAGAIGATIALMGTSAWMLSRAAQRPGEAALGLAIVAVQVFGLSRGFLRYGERLVGHDAAFRFLAKLRVRLYTRLELLAPTGLVAFSRGDLLARMVGDVDSLQELLLRVVPPFATAVLVGGATVAALWWLLPAAGLVTLAALLLAATLVPALTSTHQHRASSREAADRGSVASTFVELVEGAAELAAFGAAGAELDHVVVLDDSLTRTARRGASTAGIGLALTTLLAGLAAAANLAVGAAAVSEGRLRGVLLGTLAVIPLAAFELVAPLPAATQSLARARECAGRVLAVLSTPPPVVEPVAPAPLSAGPHSVQLRSVSAAYPGSSNLAVRGVDLAVPAGRFVAIVGPSGAGKSTLAALLEDFLTPVAGAVELDGVAYTSFASDDLRAVVGVVDQLPHLFDTSLAANLRIGRPDAGDDDLVRVLELVGLGAFLAELPAGLATEVGHTGARLSGGQRQRIGVARALLAEFDVLILDEPAEHLGMDAARQLVETVLEVAPGRSTVLITHRLAGLEDAHEIVVLVGGEVAERGTHDELMSAATLYATWWHAEQRAG